MRDTLAHFQKATEKQDYRALCTKLLARAVIARLRSVGLPCEVALQTGLGSVRQPKLNKGIDAKGPMSQMLDQFATIRADLRFREDGIHTTITMKRNAAK